MVQESQEYGTGTGSYSVTYIHRRFIFNYIVYNILSTPSELGSLGPRPRGKQDHRGAFVPRGGASPRLPTASITSRGEESVGWTSYMRRSELRLI